jgi:hypothetical protein
MPLTKRKRWLLGVVVALIFARAGYVGYVGAPVVTIVNASAGAVTAVVLRGRDFVESVGSLGPGRMTGVVVRPLGESGLELLFSAQGREFAQKVDAYIEAGGGYCVTLTIDAELMVSSTGAAVCFSLRRAALLW